MALSTMNSVQQAGRSVFSRSISYFTAQLRQAVRNFFSEPITQYTIIITFVVVLLAMLQVLFEIMTRSAWNVPVFLSEADKQLVMNFVEWFGVLYGFLLPTILVRVWEQFDEIDNTLDREADAVKILMGDLLLLHSEYTEFSLRVLRSLQEYSQGVLDFINGTKNNADEIRDGNELLVNIRKHYLGVFHHTGKTKESDVLIDELLTQLNTLIDNRGDRISLSTQRLFQSLRFLALVTSIVWLVPFYFLYFQDQTSHEYLRLGLFGWFLVISVTFLVIIILTIIDDLDKPFDGFWMVNKESWVNLVADLGRETKPELPFNMIRTHFFVLRDYSGKHTSRKIHKKTKRIRR